MKLKRDFGVRALLATLAMLVFAVAAIPLALKADVETLKVVGLVVGPVVMVPLAFYFGQRSGSGTSAP